MADSLTTQTVWEAMQKELFAVLGMVTAKNEARTVGIVYVIHHQKLYIATGREAWKARHIDRNPNVSLTVTIPKRIPFLPWIKIPAATITFNGLGRVLSPDQVDAAILYGLLRDTAKDEAALSALCVIEVEPVGNFITYGIGVSLSDMRDRDKARGRVPV